VVGVNFITWHLGTRRVFQILKVLRRFGKHCSNFILGECLWGLASRCSWRWVVVKIKEGFYSICSDRVVEKKRLWKYFWRPYGGKRGDKKFYQLYFEHDRILLHFFKCIIQQPHHSTLFFFCGRWGGHQLNLLCIDLSHFYWETSYWATDSVGE
jgi:hypothetical protein